MQSKAHICPYLDLADGRCASRLTINTLAEAFRYCFGDPTRCPVYAMLHLEQGAQERSRLVEAAA